MQGTGAQDDPYIVTTAQELYDIRAGGSTPGTTSTWYRQGNDITIPPELSEIWCLGTNAQKIYNFREYAGNGYKVSGLNFNEPSVDNVGLFPIVSTTTKNIRDLGVDCNIVGGNNVGGICGSNSNGSSYGSSITNCYATGAVSGTSNVGGLCGSNSSSYGTSTITNCYATGAVSGSSNVGGICGLNEGRSGSYVNARIIGCFALNPKIIRDKYAPANDTFGRIFGASSSHTLDRNYALETMLFYPNGDE